MIPALTASFFSLSGAGFGEPARYDFEQRCGAAGRAGFAGVGLTAADFNQLRGNGFDDRRLREVLAATQVEVTEIEFLSGWARRDIPLGEFAQMAQVFTPHHVTGGEFDPGEIDVPAAARRLRALAQEMDGFGVKVAIEPFAWSGINTIATARRLIDAANMPNVGLLIDVWHFYNCRATMDDLAGLGSEQIIAMQMNGGRLVDGDFLVEARSGRLLPGDGELDGVGLVRDLRSFGFDGPFCVEVNYPQYRALPIAEMASVAYTKAAAVLAASLT